MYDSTNKPQKYSEEYYQKLAMARKIAERKRQEQARRLRAAKLYFKK